MDIDTETQFDDAIEAAVAKQQQSPEEPQPEPEKPEEVQATDEKAAEEAESELPSVILARLADKDAELEALRRELKQVKQAPPEEKPPETPTENILQEAVAAGLSADQIHSLLLAQELGADAPDDVRAEAARVQYDLRLRRLEQPKAPAKDDKKQQDPVLVAQVALMQQQIDSYVDAGVPEQFEMFSRHAEKNPDDARQAIETLTATLYQSEGRWPSLGRVARLIEDSMEEKYNEYASYKGVNTTASRKTTQVEAQRHEEALSDADTADLPDRGGAEDDPLLPWEEQVKQAIQRRRKR